MSNSNFNPTEFRDLDGQGNSKIQVRGSAVPGLTTGPVDITSLPHNELVQRVRKLEADLLKLASDHNHMIREANHHIQVRFEIRYSKSNYIPTRNACNIWNIKYTLCPHKTLTVFLRFVPSCMESWDGMSGKYLSLSRDTPSFIFTRITVHIRLQIQIRIY